MTATHSLTAGAFTALAGGAGDSGVIGQLREAQLSKHLMLLRVVAEAATGTGPSSPAAAAFGAGYRLLARVQAADPGTVARLLCLPHIGGWAHDCLSCLDNGSEPDFGYLAAVAASAAVRSGIPFELAVRAGDGRVLLPGLGCLHVPGQAEWVRLSSDGVRLRAAVTVDSGQTDPAQIDVACAALKPDDGSDSTDGTGISDSTVPCWRGTPLVRAVADGQTWEVLLETDDRYLDRYTLPMLTAVTAAEVTVWRQRIQAAWELLVRHHDWAAGPVASGVDAIVPLVPRSDLDSATSPAAFGAIATSLPPSPVSMAETLVHEFQHIKLCGLMDMLPLVKPSGEKGYAPWREDPRPMGGILQGVYAFAGIVRLWNEQRCLETEPDAVLRANVLYERWRLVIEPVARTLVESGLLTPVGARFVTMLSECESRRQSAPVPADAAEIAREMALDNWLTWRLTHTALDATAVTGLAAAYERGDPLSGRALPEASIGEDLRKIDSIPRSRVLHMRFQEPRRFQQLSAARIPGLSQADVLLVRGDADAAVAAYRAGLAAEPDPAAWIGLALAAARLPAPLRPVLAAQLPLLCETHACLASRGIHVDPLDLAAWFERGAGPFHGRLVADLSLLAGLQIVRFDFRGEPGSLCRRPCLGVLQGERPLVAAQDLGDPPVSAVGIPGRRLVAGQVGRRHQRVRVIAAEVEAAFVERLQAKLDRLAQPAGRGEIRGVVDAGRQCEGVPATVDLNEPLPGLVVIGKCHFRVPGHAQYRRQVHQDGVEQNVGSTGFPAEIVRLTGQFLGAGKVSDRAPVVDQVGGRSKRVHMIGAQVVAAALEDMFAFLERVPVVAVFAQRRGEPFARLQPADVLPAAGLLERGDDPPRHVERLLVQAEAAQITGHRVRGVESVHVIGAQDPAAVRQCAACRSPGPHGTVPGSGDRSRCCS